MNEYKNYYTVLGLKKNAYGAEIEKAYKRLIKNIQAQTKQCNPRRCPGDKTARAHYSDLRKVEMEIQQAYELLKHSAVRRDYQELGYIPLYKHGFIKLKNDYIQHVSNVGLSDLFSL